MGADRATGRARLAALSGDALDVELFSYLAAFEWHDALDALPLAFTDTDAVEGYMMGLDTPLQQMWFFWKERSGELVLTGHMKGRGWKRCKRDDFKIEWLWEQMPREGKP
jgi:hypothetical protein